jgi:uncharacterized protein (TIGR02646 family)
LIKLKKLDPDVEDSTAAEFREAIRWLADQRTRFLADFHAGVLTTKFATKYRDPRVKEAILFETHRKCAYCESRYMATTFGDVEHILPKAGAPERLLEYANLTLACTRCNNAKSDSEYSDGAPLLNPYEDDPADFLVALGPLISPRYELEDTIRSLRAARTIDDIELNRNDLMERRRDYIQGQCRNLIESYRLTKQPALRELVRRRIQKLCNDDSEYAMTARHYFKKMGFS